ncbi:hypothetical protein HY212_03845 [Candidatus Pacearchaeota archaeon]|nr:hypothetical protein [Candidatus Pacearchaeota archaeon]
MDIAVKRLFFIFGIALILVVLIGIVSATQTNVAGVAKRGIHDNIADAVNPILSADDSVKLLDYYNADPANADQNIFSSDLGGIFAVGVAGVSENSNVGSHKKCGLTYGNCAVDEICQPVDPNLVIGGNNPLGGDVISGYADENPLGLCVKASELCDETNPCQSGYECSKNEICIKKACVPQEDRLTCLDGCGIQFNNCEVPVDCGVCTNTNGNDCISDPVNVTCLENSCGLKNNNCGETVDCTAVRGECGDGKICASGGVCSPIIGNGTDQHDCGSGEFDDATECPGSEVCINSKCVQANLNQCQDYRQCPSPGIELCLHGFCKPVVGCVDSDNGLTYNTKGTTYAVVSPELGAELGDIGINNLTDYCGVQGTESGKLVEFSCNNMARITKTLYSCINGCSSGACVVGQTCTSQSDSLLCGNWQCGTKTNNCGQEVTCGTGCPTDSICDNGICKPSPGQNISLILDVTMTTPSSLLGVVESDGYVRATASWNVVAYDPKNTSYLRIDWGDGSYTITKRSSSDYSSYNVNHKYSFYSPDSYNYHDVTFTLTDAQGASVSEETPLTVTFNTQSNGGAGTSGEITITSPMGGNFSIGGILPIKWTAPSTVSTVTIYGMTKLSTGSWSSNLIANNVPSSGGGQYNFLLGTPGTNIQVIGYDSSTKTYLSDMSDAFTLNTMQAPNPGFVILGRVQVISEIYPRTTPNGYNNYYDFNGTYIQQPQGKFGTSYYNNKGTILDGPVVEAALTWWKVDFDTGTDGWMTTSYIKVINESNVPFAFTSDSLINPSSVYAGDSNIWHFGTNVPDGSKASCGIGQGVKYEISFGDGTTTVYYDDCPSLMGYAGESAMKHTYTTNKTFTITGKAISNVTGWIGTAIKTLSVVASFKPLAVNKFEVQSVDSKGMISQMRVLASGGAPGNLMFKINWGDNTADSSYNGTSGVTNNPTHTYSSIANWNPTLTVTNLVGQTVTKKLYLDSQIKKPTISNVICPSTFTRTNTLSYITCTFRIDSIDGSFIWYSLDWNGDGVADISSPSGGYLSGQTFTESKACSTAICSAGIWPVTIRARAGWWSEPVVKNIAVS